MRAWQLEETPAAQEAGVTFLSIGEGTSEQIANDHMILAQYPE
jgi:hypothetical protein